MPEHTADLLSCGGSKEVVEDHPTMYLVDSLEREKWEHVLNSEEYTFTSFKKKKVKTDTDGLDPVAVCLDEFELQPEMVFPPFQMKLEFFLQNPLHHVLRELKEKRLSSHFKIIHSKNYFPVSRRPSSNVCQHRCFLDLLIEMANHTSVQKPNLLGTSS
ncbi:hypothetical protein H5410_021000 [Solanum commersonii]|uniref:Uncharacterized protein n=1 Tax=Solanum commersonii TaxID=4109 RepID=A0A9J5ZCR5_SOLCO|nr:hypothetical protein H5410_021000 [Solanum commersonii]